MCEFEMSLNPVLFSSTSSTSGFLWASYYEGKVQGSPKSAETADTAQENQ